MKTETRLIEIRTEDEGRIITGRAVPYEAEGRKGTMRERFTSGAAEPSGDAVLNVGHDRSRPIAREPQSLRFEQRADGLWFTADLPETRDADDCLANIRAGIFKGASVEFICKADRFICGVREVREAVIQGLAIVLNPAYPDAHIQTRDKEPKRNQIWWW